ncbi:MAG: PTS sugar transporter subunit IIA [Verrucomicrobia bacterium]|nr:PTS sugar transporter subunit IIA [Verrucomicrobiota bacterium]
MYLNVIQLAESFGVEEAVVDGWIRDEGLPCIHDRERLLFDRAQVATWAAERGLAAKAGFLAPQPQTTRSGPRLETLLRAGGITRDMPAADVPNVLERIVSALPGVTPPVRQLLAQRLRAPGGINWAPVGRGFALPHLRANAALGRDSGILAIVLLHDALPLDEPPPDGVPVTRLLFFIAPTPRAHLELLAQLSAALARGPLRELLAKAAPDNEILAALAAADAAPAKRTKEAVA